MIALDILHRDDDLLIVDKPAGLATHAAFDDPVPGDVVAILRRQLDLDYLAVHQRLDRDTSGVLMFGLRPEANRRLSIAFERRLVEKRYVAVVRGVPRDDEGWIDAPIAPAKGERRAIASAADPRGLPARTRFSVLERSTDGAFTLLELQPETGRTHQLRLHLLHIGHPIVGDTLYDAEHSAPRLMLHSQRLVLPESRGRPRLAVDAAVPAIFHELIAAGRGLLQLSSDPRSQRGVLRPLFAAAFARREPLLRGGEHALRLIDAASDALDGVTLDLLGDVAALNHGNEWTTTELVSEIGRKLSGYVFTVDDGNGAMGRRGESGLPESTELGGVSFTTSWRSGAVAWPRVWMRDHIERVRAWCAGRRVVAFDGAELSVAAATVASDLLIVESRRDRLARIVDAIALNSAAVPAPGLLLGDVLDQLDRLSRRGRLFDVVIVDMSPHRQIAAATIAQIPSAAASLVSDHGEALFLARSDADRRIVRGAFASGQSRSGLRRVHLQSFPSNRLDAPGGFDLLRVRPDRSDAP